MVNTPKLWSHWNDGGKIFSNQKCKKKERKKKKKKMTKAIKLAAAIITQEGFERKKKKIPGRKPCRHVRASFAKNQIYRSKIV